MNFKFWQRKKKSNETVIDDQPEYQVKSYSKDGGYIRSPVRTGKNQNSSSFGGMGERELQLRLELLVEPILSTHNSVFEPAQALVNFSLADQERFLESIDSIALTNVELAFNFCHYAPYSLRVVDEENWQAWVTHLLKIHTTKGLNDCIAAMQAVDEYVDSFAIAPTSVSFDEISRIIESIITGLNGRALKLEQGEQLFTDTEVIHLPENIATFKSRDDNFALYKSIAVHQWAQTWYGTWRVDIQQLVANFADKQKAIDLFHKLETVRLDANIKRELPGIGRAIEKFSSLLVAKDLSLPWQSAIKTLSSEEASAHDTARLLYELYDHDFIPQDTLYQGVLNPDLARQTMNERIDQDKEELKLALDELQKESIGNNQDMPVDDGQDGNRFEVREIEDDEMPDGYRYELELNGDSIDPPENIQELLESIQQDLGEIPDDYLSPVDDNAYKTGNGEDIQDNINIRSGSGEVFLYDEWDHSRQKYRKEWCHLREIDVEGKPSDFVEQTLNKHRSLLKHLHRTFEALRDEDRRVRKQPYGEDIDLDAIISSYADMINGEEVSQNLFIKQRKVDRNIAVMFMVDMSGSTSGWINDMEREALVLLCESLEVLGDRYAIYGFSGLTHRRCDLYKIKDFEESYSATVKDRIANIKPQDYTRMGAAIRHLSKLLSCVEAKTKVLITLSDGRPDDQDGYRGAYGIEDTRRALIESKFLGIYPFCITIDDEAMDYLQYMYGPVNFTIVDQVDKLPYKVSDIYRRITM
ncbi:MAG: VWA domain-containing protein [Gammaproteobacteria bacterium]|nr:VWA domain-containing protein [Gammaproteobacteria bacterium]